ncbi:MAG: hypothetical protein H7A35_14760 [Planctomycetales bacterium]|nr:hypothetical protein [bacterium]UNM08092.1 MAG: hypothetical protein H7A35_14760 [Planctomycetales bacterium]
MSAIRDVMQVKANHIPAGIGACYVRYRLPAEIDPFLPGLFNDAVTVFSPMQECQGDCICLIEACSPGRYSACSFQGSVELEVYFEAGSTSLPELISGFDARIESVGLGSVEHSRRIETVTAD